MLVIEFKLGIEFYMRGESRRWDDDDENIREKMKGFNETDLYPSPVP